MQFFFWTGKKTLRIFDRNYTFFNISAASKTGLRFIVADSEDEEAGISEDDYSDLASGTSMNNLVERSKCETTFSRTTFANNAGYPNCGTFFVQHISDDEAMFDNGNNLSLQNNSLDENDNR